MTGREEFISVISNPWLKIGLSFLYFTGYLFLTVLVFSPHGRGPTVLIAPIVPWPLLFITSALLGREFALQRQIMFVGLMMAHYAITTLGIYYFTNEFSLESETFLDLWLKGYSLILLPGCWYIGGQLFLWGLFALNRTVVAHLSANCPSENAMSTLGLDSRP
jgi:hypothetical protein